MLIQAKNLNFKTATKGNCNLSSITVQRMILRLLNDAKMSKPKLTQCLGITMTELAKLAGNKASSELVKRISLPLVDRYCLTEFTTINSTL